MYVISPYTYTALCFTSPKSGSIGGFDCYILSQMCALPYVMSDPGFHGRVYATEPCLMMGSLILLALARYMEQSPIIRAEV